MVAVLRETKHLSQDCILSTILSALVLRADRAGVLVLSERYIDRNDVSAGVHAARSIDVSLLAKQITWVTQNGAAVTLFAATYLVHAFRQAARLSLDARRGAARALA